MADLYRELPNIKRQLPVMGAPVNTIPGVVPVMDASIERVPQPVAPTLQAIERAPQPVYGQIPTITPFAPVQSIPGTVRPVDMYAGDPTLRRVPQPVNQPGVNQSPTMTAPVAFNPITTAANTINQEQVGVFNAYKPQDEPQISKEPQTQAITQATTPTQPVTSQPAQQTNAIQTTPAQQPVTNTPINLDLNAPEGSLVDQYQQLRNQAGISGLEQAVNDLTKQERDIQAQKRQRIQSEEGKAVALNVISGRVSEVERQENERLDAIGRQRAYAIDQLNSAYKNIETIMTLKKQDYDMAKEKYDTEFAQNMQMMKFMQDSEDRKITLADKARDNARANAQIMANTLKESGVSYGDLSTDQKLELSKLELQSGLPSGFFSLVQQSMDGQILSTNKLPSGEVQVVTKSSGGKINVKSFNTEGTATSGNVQYSPKEFQSRVSSAIKTLNDIDAKYRTVGGKLVEATSKTVYDGYGNATKQKPTGDKLLTNEEASKALQSILESVGGNSALAQEIFKNAIKAGGFKGYKDGKVIDFNI